MVLIKVSWFSVGRELIQGNWKAAVELMMTGHKGERADAAQARALFLEHGDAAAALKQMPRHQGVERALLEASNGLITPLVPTH